MDCRGSTPTSGVGAEKSNTDREGDSDQHQGATKDREWASFLSGGTGHLCPKTSELRE